MTLRVRGLSDEEAQRLARMARSQKLVPVSSAAPGSSGTRLTA
jgi:hypothetical protein